MNALLIRNLLLGGITVLLLLALYRFVPGYSWAVNEVGLKNMELTNRIKTKRKESGLPPISLEEKRFLKIENYYYLKYINENTPYSAVILLPPREAVAGKPEFELLYDSEWVSYFLFPRLCISESERFTKPKLYSMITHVAIVNGWGYEKLRYSPTTNEPEDILPIDAPTKQPAQ
jgi:hypothetical protein